MGNVSNIMDGSNGKELRNTSSKLRNVNSHISKMDQILKTANFIEFECMMFSYKLVSQCFYKFSKYFI